MFGSVKKRMGAALLWILLAVPAIGFGVPGLVPSAALAQEGEDLLQIALSARPDELVEPGDVTLTFTIENISEQDARNVYISSSDGLMSEPVGQVAAGETQSFNRQHSVTEEELEAGEITYTISHDDPDQPNAKINYTVHVQIQRSDIRPEAEFTRQFSSRSVASGGTLTVVYRVRNTGNVALRNLRVQDSLGDYTGRIDRLEVGQSRSLISRVTLSEPDTSSASLSFNVEGEGDENFVSTLEDVFVPLAEAGMDQLFSVSRVSGSEDTAEALLLLYNTGDVAYREICVTDAVYGGIIADALVLPVGNDPLEIRHRYAVRGQDSFCWRVTGVGENGETVELITPAIELPAPAQEADAAPLTLSVEALTPRIRRSGDVTLRVRISNPGPVGVEDIVLMEAGLGEVRSFAVLGPGDSLTRDLSVHVDQDISYQFSIRYPGAEGEETVAAAPVEVVIASDGVLPEGARPPFIEFTGTSIKIGGSSTFAVLLIAGCAVLMVLIVMLVVASRKVRLEKQLRIAAEKKRRREQGRAPARGAKNKSKGRN